VLEAEVVRWMEEVRWEGEARWVKGKGEKEWWVCGRRWRIWESELCEKGEGVMRGVQEEEEEVLNVGVPSSIFVTDCMSMEVAGSKYTSEIGSTSGRQPCSPMLRLISNKRRVGGRERRRSKRGRRKNGENKM